MADTKKTPTYLKDLWDNDPGKVMNALGKVEKRGDHRSVEPLVRILVERDEPELQNKVMSILGSIKDEKAIPELFRSMEEDDLLPARAQVLNALWNSGLELNDRLEHLVRIAVESEFGECFECVTIIEHQPGPFPEDQLTDALILLRSHLQDEPEGQRKALLDGLLRFLEGPDHA